MQEPRTQFLDVADHDLLSLGVGCLVSRVDLIAAQYVLDQCLATRDYQLAIRHAEVGFDDGLLSGVQAAIGGEDDRHFGVPLLIQLAGVLRLIEQIRLAAQAAEYKVAILAVLLAIRAHMPAHAGVDQRVWGNQADFHIWCVERNVFGFQAQTIAASLE